MIENILLAIEQISEEKGIKKEQVLEAIEQALAAAYRKDFGNKLQNIKIEFDPESGKMKAFDEKTVVKDAEENDDEEEEEEKNAETKEEEGEPIKRFNPKTEIYLSDAIKIKAKAIIDDIIKMPLEIPSNFGRIAAQTAKQVIIQRLRETEREVIYERFKEKAGTIISGVVQRIERQAIFVDVENTVAKMPYEEQVKEEKYFLEQKLKFYIVNVSMTPKGPEIIISRKHPDILKELFISEIPEIGNNLIKIEAIAREPGSRAKIAVWTKEKSIDPIGACIGQRGSRIQTIINEVGGEKIDIVEFDKDIEKYIANSLSPAKISSIKLKKKEKIAIVRVKKDQLSLAIGKFGQNVRLASRLTEWKISIEEEATKESLDDKQTKDKDAPEETVTTKDKIENEQKVVETKSTKSKAGGKKKLTDKKKTSKNTKKTKEKEKE
ncbi:transcription termination/antitermination protein NusA [Patescibacteria group bacterium]|nr:transcription termination/antitermination protein NusA [Patescibacteria group bacterium]